ncbi:MAG TPA: hypothetical protein VNT53_00290 [Pseudolysinimonas sp.]|nr:hypothetical protein [Pseudolysinimonas sp.]
MSGYTPESGRPAEDPTPSDVAPEPITPVETGGVPTTDPAQREVVYVAAPVPPRPHGNRGVGTVLAVLGSLVFAALYSGVVYIAFQLARPDTGTSGFIDFIQNAAFWVPTGVFFVVFILVTLVLNRAGWWAHVLGSLVVAVLVYLASIGLLLALSGVVSVASGSDKASFTDLATQPFLIIAAIVAREVSIWIGLGIATRGRRVSARNMDSRARWEQEQVEAKADYERANAGL